MAINKAIEQAVRHHVNMPAHIDCCAAAVRYDLMYGPAWAYIPPEGVEEFTLDDFATFREDLEDQVQPDGRIEPVYTGAAGNALRAFIDGLPSVLYYEEDSGYVGDHEPQGEWVDTGDAWDEHEGHYDSDDQRESKDGTLEEWCDPPSYRELDARDIVRALFGDIIAREFH